jgi:hypothetical protein
MTGEAEQLQLVHYIPILTTGFAAVFAVVLIRRWLTRKSGPHLLWWTAGVVAYGIGTALEGSITLFGNSIALTKAWYVAGALLGGYPLAQGSVYLLLERRTANILTALSLPFIAAVAVLVIIAPVDMSAFEAHRPTGAVLAWTWVRAMTPIINLYAVIFLIGGAILSAVRFAKKTDPGAGYRAAGNALIAFGAILPGIGGTMAKMGMIEALYIGEFVGLLFIWAGFSTATRSSKAVSAEPVTA